MWKKSILLLTVVFALVLAACAGPPAAEPAEPAVEEPAVEEPTEEAPEEPAEPAVEELRIIWAEWDPAKYLQQLVNEYEAVSGVKVKVVEEPWGTFPDRVFAEFAAKGTAYDMVVGDSQWMGQGVEQGHYVELTEWFMEDFNGKALAPATVKVYAEYPAGSGKYWAYPTEGDAMGWGYRKDLFEDPDEMEAFEAEYGYPLDVPETWEQLLDIAEFFTRPDENLYGVAPHVSKDYDIMTMGFENVLFSYGGAWGDYETFQVDGIVNSPRNVEALELWKELYQYAPPGAGTMDWAATTDAFISGQVAMEQNFYAWWPPLATTATNPHADVTGFFNNPAGPGGERGAALGGQAISIVSYISPERQEACKDFLRWFGESDVQKQWGELGGYTCNAEVLEGDAFLDFTPYNRAFAEAMTMVDDFWNIPDYAALLEVTQRELHKYVIADEGTAQEALDTIAEEHEKILREAGYIE
jgi:multiple sugar transport system substrate-binding protein